MRFDNTLTAFQNNLSDMARASSKVQAGFSRILDKDNVPTQQESTEFVSAFVEEDFAARLAEAQLKVLKTQDDVLETVLDIKS